MVKKRKDIKIVFFDLDDTLYSHKCTNSKIKSELKALEFFCQKHPKLKLTDVYKVFNEAKDHTRKEYNDISPMCSRELWFIEFLEKEHELDKKLAKKMEHIYWETLHNHIEPFYDAELLLKYLSKKGYRLGIITNGIRKFQMLRLKSLKLTKYFDYIITSSDTGYEKSHGPETFEYALKKARCKPEQAFMVGDCPAEDIRWANVIRMNTVWLRRGHRYYYQPHGKENPDYIIENHVELMDIL